MGGRLVSIVFMSVFLLAKGLAPLAPELTVHPLIITEADLVHLNCQTSPRPESKCFFNFEGKHFHQSQCETSKRGRELLSILNKTSPVDITVTCLYRTTDWSPDSDKKTISIRDLAPPSLTADPSVISDTDTVTLRCRPPAVASVPLCVFFTNNGGRWVRSDCVQTLRGSKLLSLNHSPPAQVQVQCYYRDNKKRRNSPYSHRRTVSVRNSKPEVSVEVHSDPVGIVCSLPGSANLNSTCYLYFGESTRPYLSTSVWGILRNERPFCKFSTSKEDLQRNLDAVEMKLISCDFTTENGLSRRSEGYNMSIFVKDVQVTLHHVTTAVSEPEKTTTPSLVTRRETTALSTDVQMTLHHVTTAVSEPEKTTTPSVVTGRETTASSTEKPVTSARTLMTETQTLTSVKLYSGSTLKESVRTTTTKPKLGNKSTLKSLIWKWVIALMAGGVTLGSVLFVLTILCTKGTNDTISPQDPDKNHMASGAYSLATFPTRGEGSDGTRAQPQSELLYEGTYHLYDTISDEPPAGAIDYSYV